MSRALIIGEVQKQAIAKLIALAAANVMDPAAMNNAAEKDMAAYRQMMRTLSVELPVGYIVTYSHERQPFGLARHLSVSLDQPNKMPHPAALDMILDAFRMLPHDQSVRLWIEDVSATIKAINVVQPCRPMTS
jgi:hypothetical protein